MDRTLLLAGLGVVLAALVAAQPDRPADQQPGGESPSTLSTTTSTFPSPVPEKDIDRIPEQMPGAH